MNNKKPVLGDTRPFGNQIQIYTISGWVICDDAKDVQEELDKIESLTRKETKNNGHSY